MQVVYNSTAKEFYPTLVELGFRQISKGVKEPEMWLKGSAIGGMAFYPHSKVLFYQNKKYLIEDCETLIYAVEKFYKTRR